MLGKSLYFTISLTCENIIATKAFLMPICFSSLWPNGRSSLAHVRSQHIRVRCRARFVEAPRSKPYLPR